jgi:hypothetical protein
MKKLMTDVLYLKSINLLGQNKNVFLSFRQEFKHEISSTKSPKQFYKNTLLILYFDKENEAIKAYETLKEEYLYDTMIVSASNPNEVEFFYAETELGFSGSDASGKIFRVKDFEEQIEEQLYDDWVDRCEYLTKEYFNMLFQYQNTLRNIREIVKSQVYEVIKINNNSNVQQLLEDIIKSVESEKNLKLNSKENLLIEINQKVNEIIRKLN